MSLVLRASLVLIQAVCNQTVCSPPNKTQSKFRYHTAEPILLQVAPLLFKIHSILLWCTAAAEAVVALNRYLGGSLSPSLSAQLDAALLPASRSQNAITPLFVVGVLFVILGAYIRARCFNELGRLFTFDLTIHPEHKLITSGPYQYARHPSYLGSLLLIIGISCSHLSAGSLATELLFGSFGSALVAVCWWLWALAVAKSRAVAEDKELQKRFGSEWDAYANSVKYWFFPGFI